MPPAVEPIRIIQVGAGAMGSGIAQVADPNPGECTFAADRRDGIVRNGHVADAVPALTREGEARLSRAMALTRLEPEGIEFAEAIAKRDTLLAQV